MICVHVGVEYIFVSPRNEKFSGVSWVRRCHLTKDWYIHHVWRLRNQTGSEIFRQHYNCRRGTSHVSPPHYIPAPYKSLHVYVPMFHSVKIILFLSSKMIYNIIISLNELLYLFVWRGLRSVVLQPWHCPVSDITMGPRWHWPLPRSPAALWGLPQSDSDPEEANMKEDRTIMSITCYLLTWNVQIRILLRVLSVFKKINPSEPRLGPHLCTVYRQRPAISGWEGPHGRGGRR